MKKTSLTITALAVLAGATTLISCAERGNMSGTGAMQQTRNNSQMDYYAATGVVEYIASDRTHATIHHQAIPGFMPAMTMDFAVKNANELNGISPGDKITFQLVQTTNGNWIEDVKRTGE